MKLKKKSVKPRYYTQHASLSSCLLEFCYFCDKWIPIEAVVKPFRNKFIKRILVPRLYLVHTIYNILVRKYVFIYYIRLVRKS